LTIWVLIELKNKSTQRDEDRNKDQKQNNNKTRYGKQYKSSCYAEGNAFYHKKKQHRNVGIKSSHP
jgi:hypothetical protein